MFQWGERARASMEIVRRNFVLKRLMEEESIDLERLGFFDGTKPHIMDPRGPQFHQRRNGNMVSECLKCRRRASLVTLRPCGCTPFCEGCMGWVASISEGKSTFQCVICDAVIKK